MTDILFHIRKSEEDEVEVWLCPKDYWDENHYCIDYSTDEMFDAMSELGFSESMEACFVQDHDYTIDTLDEDEDDSDINRYTAEQVKALLLDKGFVQDPEFDVFMSRND